MLQVQPDDDDLPGFFACIFCLRSWNTLNLLTETTAILKGEVTWCSKGKREPMPSTNPYHTGTTV